jgi:hypothetical protein
VHFYWVVQHGDVDAFQWFLHQIGELEDEVARQKHLTQGAAWVNSCTMHLFVTRAALSEQKETNRLFVKQKVNCAPHGPEQRFSVERLYQEMMNPSVSSKHLLTTVLQAQKDVKPDNMQQDVWVWAGRPEWEQIFYQIRSQVTETKVGVFVSEQYYYFHALLCVVFIILPTEMNSLFSIAAVLRRLRDRSRYQSYVQKVYPPQ